jgi:hypothetical protein
MLIHFALLSLMQIKHGDEVIVDLLEAGEIQSLTNFLHEFLEYQNTYNSSMR